MTVIFNRTQDSDYSFRLRFLINLSLNSLFKRKNYQIIFFQIKRLHKSKFLFGMDKQSKIELKKKRLENMIWLREPKIVEFRFFNFRLKKVK